MEPQRHAGQDRDDEVVSVSVDSALLHEALSAVKAQAHTLTRSGSLSVAFYHWTLGVELPAEQRVQMAQELSDEIASSGRTIQAVAALGFLLAIDPSLSGACRNAFAQGVDWLLGRVGGSQNSMASLMQPLAHTGVLVGLFAVTDEERWQKFGAWFAALLAKLQPDLLADSGWRHELLSMIKMRSGLAIGDASMVALATSCETVYVARGLSESASATDRDFVARLLGRIKSVLYEEPEQAALDLAAFGFLAQGASQIDLRAPSLEDVGLLLQRIPSGLRRWTWDEQKKTPNSTAQKWAVENEYHFQNLLCAVLSPVFPDLRDEEWLGSVGHKKPRADLVIPSLYLVIEVKYWRDKSAPQELISEIAEDVSLYLKASSPYRKVLPIVWDQGRRTEQYNLLTAGLSEIRDVVSPVVVAQPAFMVLAATS